MKKTLIYRNAIALYLVIVTTGCLKEPAPQYEKVEPETLRKAATLKEGSYFVYKDSSSETDSFWVTSFKLSQGGGPEQINSYLQDTRGNRFMVITSPRLSGRPTLYGKFQNCFTELISYPFEENTSQEHAYNLKHYPTLLVNGRTYSDVYETFTFRQNTDWPNDTVFSFHAFYSTESGLVKFSYYHYSDTFFNTSNIWELERSKIIR